MNLSSYSDINFQAPPLAEEMLKISDEISRHYSPIASLKTSTNRGKPSLSAREMLEVSDNISLYYSPKLLPKNTSLTVLAVDPSHLYIFWNLAEGNAKTMNSDELILRIYSQPEQDKVHAQSTPLFEIPIHSIQFQKKIKVPIASEPTVYSAYIGKHPSKKNFLSLVKSNKLHTCMPVVRATSSNSDIVSAGSELIEPVHSHSFFTSENLHYAATNQSGQRKITLQ